MCLPLSGSSSSQPEEFVSMCCSEEQYEAQADGVFSLFTSEIILCHVDDHFFPYFAVTEKHFV